MKRLVGIVGLALLVAGCGAASKPYAAPPASPAAAPAQGYPEAEKAPAGAAAPSTATQAQPSAPMAPEPSPAPPAATARDESAPRSTAGEGMRQLEAAERDVASSDCTTACRALGSMERAVVFLCVSAQSGDDSARCGDAKGRLVGARKRVRASCGACPSGPSVDPDAPIPSRR